MGEAARKQTARHGARAKLIDGEMRITRFANGATKRVEFYLDRFTQDEAYAAISAIKRRFEEAQGRMEFFDLAQHLARQSAFSAATFGPGAQTKGVVDHIRKELEEIEAQPLRLEEWIDVVILALDGAWRTGASPAEIIRGLVGKQATNEKRQWPDWRTADQDKAIEHDRSDKVVAEEGQ